jgi:hypothetical protein
VTTARPKPVKTGRTEAQVLGQVIEAARVLGIDLSRQNTGAGTNPAGKTVRFGTPGNSDLTGMLPDGRKLDVEVKREHFDPSRLRGKKREHFERQLARLRRTNDQGGVGFWIDDAVEFVSVVRWCLGGGRVEEPGYSNLILVPREA